LTKQLKVFDLFELVVGCYDVGADTLAELSLGQKIKNQYFVALSHFLVINTPDSITFLRPDTNAQRHEN
jgi:hypothetical protein